MTADDGDLRDNRAVNPSRIPAEGGRDDEADPNDDDNLAVNPSRPPAEGGRDDAG